MGRRWVVAAMLPLCACGASLGDGPGDASQGNDPDGNNQNMQDDAPDGRVMLGPWGTAAKIPGADTAADEDDVVVVAVAPVLTGLQRADDRVPGLVVMGGRVPIRRGIAAADLAA